MMVDITSGEVILAVLVLAAIILITVAYALFKRLVQTMKMLAAGLLTCIGIVVVIIIAIAVFIFFF